MNKKDSRQEKVSIDFRIIMAITFTLIFWASAFAGIRVGLKAYSPENLVLFRFLTASLVLWYFLDKFQFVVKRSDDEKNISIKSPWKDKKITESKR